MVIEPTIGEIILIKDKYYTCRRKNDDSKIHCSLCNLILLSDECMCFECTRKGRKDKLSVYFEQIEPVPSSKVDRVLFH